MIQNARPRVAIIGSGIAGCSAAIFLRDAVPGASIQVLEREPFIGGRIRTIDFHGCLIETGASFFHSSNELLMALVERSGLDLTRRHRIRVEEQTPVGVWNGTRFVARLRNNRAYSTLSLVAQYGGSLIRVRRLAMRILRRWRRVYRLESTGAIFNSPADLMAGLDLADLVGQDLNQWLSAARVRPAFIHELIDSVSRSIYNQDSHINACAGMIALIGSGIAGGRTLSVTDGNSTLCEHLLRQAGAKLSLSRHVRGIRTRLNQSSREVALIDDAGTEELFDAVIVAAPGKRSGIQIVEGDTVREWAESGDVQMTRVLCVVGRLRAEYFGVPDGTALPRMVMTVESGAIPFSTITYSGLAEGRAESVYKIQSRERLSEAILNALFVEFSDVKEIVWAAYPILRPLTSLPPFRIGAGVYHPNAMESVVSTMETAVLSSRNAVAMLAADLKGV